MGLTAVGAASAIGGVANAIIGGRASNKAADAQVQAANTASSTQLDMFNKIRQDLQPYMNIGTQGGNLLSAFMNNGSLTSSYPAYTPYGEYTPVTAENLENTPGYQFTRDQGMKSLLSSGSANGLTGSGAQAKGLAEYITGLAQSTYNQQVQNSMAQYQTGMAGHVQDYTTGFNANQTDKTNIFNRLLALTNLGQNSAAQVGNYGTQTAGTIGGNIIGAGNASAAGTIGAGNAIAGGLNTAVTGGANAYLANQLLAKYTGAAQNPNAAAVAQAAS